MTNLYEYLSKNTARTLTGLALLVSLYGCGTLKDTRIHPITQEQIGGQESDSLATISKDQVNDYAIINGKLQPKLRPKPQPKPKEKPYAIVTGEGVETTSASLDSVLYKAKPDSTK